MATLRGWTTSVTYRPMTGWRLTTHSLYLYFRLQNLVHGWHPAESISSRPGHEQGTISRPVDSRGHHGASHAQVLHRQETLDLYWGRPRGPRHECKVHRAHTLFAKIFQDTSSGNKDIFNYLLKRAILFCPYFLAGKNLIKTSVFSGILKSVSW